MSKRKNVIRVGDRVKIIDPLQFVRVGYALTVEDVRESHITQDQAHLLKQLINSTGYKLDYTMFPDSEYSRLETALARLILKTKKFGGPDRSVHTQYMIEYLGKLGTVRAKRYVKTGIYQNGTSYQGYYDDYPEYEPPYLKNEKTVVIYQIEIDSDTWHNFVEFPHGTIEKIQEPKYDVQEQLDKVI